MTGPTCSSTNRSQETTIGGDTSTLRISSQRRRNERQRIRRRLREARALSRQP
ncbi:hypothetical protein [Sinorhizobium alkalisoli]|uniref:hypothetical protein n=1 Tax=Sinorhizobium alkalisoli TaxID=1752398 RepID=UPI001FD94574|nr:hypothetical protein [Sinorhizobium alkalisoli]